MWADTLVMVPVLGIVMGAVEFAVRHWHIPAAVGRKILHVLMCLAIVSSTIFVDYRVYIWCGAIFTVVMAASRHWHMASLASRRADSIGEVCFPFGVGVAALVSDRQAAFMLAVALLGAADTLAFVVGSRFGHPIRTGKSFAGSAAFIVTALVILLPTVPAPIAFATAVMATIGEAVGVRGWDNVVIPVVTALCLRYAGF